MRMGKLVLVELQIFVWIRSSLLYLPLSLLDLPCFFDFSPLGGVSCSVSDSDPDCDLFGLSFLDLLFLLPFFFPFLFGYGEWFLLFEDCPLCRDDELVLPFSLPLLLLLPLSFFLGQSLLRCPGC